MTYRGETTVEEAALSWFEGLGYTILHGPDIAPGEPNQERRCYGDVVLTGRLENALADINPHLPAAARDEVVKKVIRTDSPALVENNRAFHRLLVEGVDVEYHAPDGRVLNDQAWLVDFNNPERNNWVAINQFTVVENHHTRRPDVVVFVNGLPLAVIELKDAAKESATLKKAFNQLQTYKNQVPCLFRCNEALILSDGLEARIGSLTAGRSRFMPWRTIDGVQVAPTAMSELQVLIEGVFDTRRFLDWVRHFVVFEDTGGEIIKKVAGYHQFHAVNKAVEATVRAASPKGDQRIGVVWHTQGSGKSLTMAFYAGKISQHPAMKNPTLVVLTDRNDLDDQLFDTFASCQGLLRQPPVQVENRDDLKEKLRVASGGVVFTTIQKFAPDNGEAVYPLLSQRRNIVFIADEAHRSQYGLRGRVTTDNTTGHTSIGYGFAKHVRDALPNASFIGFTGTPIETADKSTYAIFGDTIDTYDIQRAVQDGATVRIFYAARLARLELDDDLRPVLDDEFEEVTENEEEHSRDKLRSRWARLESVVGADDRIKQIAVDIVQHFDNRQSTMDGKAMIVTMSRRICVELYQQIVALRPDWHNEDDNAGTIKVIMTGSASDPEHWQSHIRNKPRRKKLADRFKDAEDPFKLVIVRDMWLTGFDAPCMHTMYIDKPMQGHGLMQAIARVNRVFKDKPGGLVVDYLGIAPQLKQALAHYTKGDQDETGIDQEEAVAVMQEKYEVVTDLFHGFDYRAFFTAEPGAQLNTIKAANEHILGLEDGKKRFLQAVLALSKAFALSVPHHEALAIRDELAFFHAVRASLIKHTVVEGGDTEDVDTAIRQLVSKAVTSDKVIDIFGDAGIDKPDLSVLSDEFLAEVQGMQQRNLAIEALRKLLNDDIKLRERKNVVQARSFSEMLENAIRRYQNRTIDAAQVIQELIALAKEMRAASKRGETLGLNEDELAFYDALEVNDSAVKVLGDETLRIIARELVETVRRNVSIDWTEKEAVKANLRRLVKRVLRKYGYPPDKEVSATKTVLRQAETLCADWAA